VVECTQIRSEETEGLVNTRVCTGQHSRERPVSHSSDCGDKTERKTIMRDGRGADSSLRYAVIFIVYNHVRGTMEQVELRT